VTVYTSSTPGQEIINLHVRSQGDPGLADSVFVRAVAGTGIDERPDTTVVRPGLGVAPNPVSGARATIDFATGHSGRCRLALYDASGALVETLLDRRLDPCRHEVRWQPGDRLAAGVYVLVLSVGPEHAVSKVVIER
jgi:hypothetical protein